MEEKPERFAALIDEFLSESLPEAQSKM